MASVQVCRWKGPWRVHVKGPRPSRGAVPGRRGGPVAGHARGAPTTTPRPATCARVWRNMEEVWSMEEYEGETVPVPVRLDAPVSVSNIL